MEFLEKPQNFQSNEQVTTLVIEGLFSFYDEDFVEMLEMLAIPHYFNRPMIKWLNKTPLNIKELQNQILHTSFVLQHGDNLLYHELFRKILLKKWSKNPEEYKKVNLGFSNYFDEIAAKEPEKHKKYHLLLEKMYHLIGADEKDGIILFGNLFEQAEKMGSVLLLEKILAFAQDQLNPTSSLTQWLNYYSTRFQFIKGDYQQSREELEVQLSQPIVDANLSYLTLHSLGLVVGRLGELNTSIEFHKRALNIARKIKTYKFIADELYQLGRNHKRLGEYEQAISFHEKSLKLYENNRDLVNEATVLLDMGNIYTYLAKWENAETAFIESYKRYKGLSNLGCAEAMQRLGWLKRMIGQLDEAEKDHLFAIDILQAIGVIFPLAEAIHSLGNVYRDQNNWLQAYETYEKALKLFKDIDATRHKGIVLKDISYVKHRLGMSEQAEIQVHKSISILEIVGDQGALCEAYFVKSLILVDKSEIDDSYIAIQRSLKIAENLYNLELLMRVLDTYAYVQWKSNRYDFLFETGNKLLSIAQSLNQDNYISRAKLILSEASIILNKDIEAVDLIVSALISASRWNSYLVNEIIDETKMIFQDIDRLFGVERGDTLRNLITHKMGNKMQISPEIFNKFDELS